VVGQAAIGPRGEYLLRGNDLARARQPFQLAPEVLPDAVDAD
jgi:hypothetical protein